MFPASHTSLNQLWAELLLEELQRRGIRHLCLAPGSRSTPLVLAAARRPGLCLHHHLDERGLGFLALGISKAADATVAVITTSGTAVANLYPALIEASLTGARLVLLTADRPPRLQDCGANQAIRQSDIFADYPRRVVRLQPPSVELPPDQLLQRLSAGLAAIESPAGGVLQVNCRFDEPLYPGAKNTDFSDYLAPLAQWRGSDAPWGEPLSPSEPVMPSAAEWQMFRDAPGMVVAGAQVRHTPAITALAQTLGWPLIADIQSPLKFDSEAVTQIDSVLAGPGRALLSRRRHLLQFGGRLVSKAFQGFIDAHDWDQFWVVHPGDYALDPGRNHNVFFALEAEPWCRGLPLPTAEVSAGARSLPLALENRALADSLNARMAADSQLGEATAVYQLLQHAPAGSTLVAGNSLAIRLLDMLAGTAPAERRLRILANRGASGIEGLIATAAGAALAGEGPVTLLLGDTAFLYDLNSLILLRQLRVPLVILVLNNDGGGIFKLLPVPDQALLEQHYQRPHGLDFAAGCAQFGVAYHCPQSLPAFTSAYQQLLANGGGVIEVRADADDTVAFVRSLTAAHKSG